MMRLRYASIVAALFGVLFCLSAVPSWGQATSTGTVTGVVTDPSNAVVPGVAIELIDTATHELRTSATNEAGRYILVNVPPGKYNITFSKKGFQNFKIFAQQVQVGLVATDDVKLPLGAATETVEVQASNVELQTMNSTVGNTVSGIALSSLPSLGRDVSTFVTLQPGVSPDGSVAGAVVDQSSFRLDGGNNTNDMDGSMSVYTPSFGGDPTGGIANQNANVAAGPTGVMPTPADSVEEFKVNTANQTADFNSSSGAEIQVVTRRGTNAWHGTAYEYYLDNNFNANTWDNNLTHTKIPGYHYSRFGASIGGPIIPFNVLGGKTYFFANYEGFRWPNFSTIERAVPTANMRAGLLTFKGQTYDMKTLDPRGIGINPLVQQMWNQFLPLPNDPGCTGSPLSGGSLLGSRCDGVNVQGYKANIALPRSDNFGVVRIDHDFGPKWHFNSSYRYYKQTRAVDQQFDIGGFFPGNKFGTPTSLANRPQEPWYYVAGLTTNFSSNTTNDFHYSFLRNWWQWSTLADPPQFAALGGALEPLGESRFTSLTPYNVNTQNTRTRFWDGKDHMLRDDVTMLKGNHLLQFGGIYQHNFNYHQRTDNGGGINYFSVYQLGDSLGAGLVDMSALVPPGFKGSKKTFSRDAAAVLGIVTDSQIAYTRTGNNLTLNPPHTPAFDQSSIPFYNVYFSDSWHMRPTFTLTYGLGWTLELPPTERNGKQVDFVDANNKPIDVQAYLNARKNAALQGQVYNPPVGFSLLGNVAGRPKYPYNPFYGSFSPRIAAAWNPHFDSDSWSGKIFGQDNTVIRGGYGRVYGRLNGVDLVLVPLLGTGLIQPVQCQLALSTGACGPATPTVATAFRIGVDGLNAPLPAASQTLPQPVFPGINNASAAAGEALDPHFRPNVVDSFDLTVQRQLSRKVTMEVGYIGRRITHEYQPININAVPYMMTLGGQSFDKAYANIETALGCVQSAGACGANVPSGKAAIKAYANGFTPQPFFETAMNPAFCAGFASCTAAVVANELGNFTTQSVWSLWSDLDNGNFNFPRSMLNTPIPGAAPCPGSALPTPCGANGQLSSGVGINASIGHGNYNAGFITLKMNDWRGLTAQSNFTYSKALGTGAFVQATSQYTADDPFNLDTMYGVQAYNRKFVYTQFFVYQPPYFNGQQGLTGHLLGGWTFAPVFATGSGEPLYCNTQTNSQGFGSGDGVNFSTNEQCIFTSKYNGGTSAHLRIPGGTDAFGNNIGTATAGTGNTAVNMFSNPVAVYGQVRPPILGIDRRDNGVGPITGMPYWNVDMSIKKNFRITERVSTEMQVVITNLFNHNQFADPTLDLSNPTTWGVITSQLSNPRQMEFGLRLNF